MMRNTARFAVALAFFGASAYAIAQGSHSGTKEEQEACEPDVYRLCSDHIPDEDKIVACLRQNKKKLSPACRKVIGD
ncbi:MAG: cysteine rich repeat-containing protein [Rhodomicrobium sp.]|jgi:hypothetical protein